MFIKIGSKNNENISTYLEVPELHLRLRVDRRWPHLERARGEGRHAGQDRQLVLVRALAVLDRRIAARAQRRVHVVADVVELRNLDTK